MSDLCLFVSATVLAYALRFEGFEWAALHRQTAAVYVLVSIAAKLYVAWSVGIYRRLWRYAGIVDVERLITSAAISGVICLALGGVVLPAVGLAEVRVPLSESTPGVPFGGRSCPRTRLDRVTPTRPLRLQGPEKVARRLARGLLCNVLLSPWRT